MRFTTDIISERKTFIDDLNDYESAISNIKEYIKDTIPVLKSKFYGNSANIEVLVSLIFNLRHNDCHSDYDKEKDCYFFYASNNYNDTKDYIFNPLIVKEYSTLTPKFFDRFLNETIWINQVSERYTKLGYKEWKDFLLSKPVESIINFLSIYIFCKEIYMQEVVDKKYLFIINK